MACAAASRRSVHPQPKKAKPRHQWIARHLAPPLRKARNMNRSARAKSRTAYRKNDGAMAAYRWGAVTEGIRAK